MLDVQNRYDDALEGIRLNRGEFYQRTRSAMKLLLKDELKELKELNRSSENLSLKHLEKSLGIPSIICRE
jgi:hypothetical protein